VEGDEAWLVAHDSGQLISVDLATGRQTGMVEIGAAATHVVVHDDSVIVGRYGTDGIGEHLTIVRRADGTTSGIETGPLGGVAPAEDGLLWAFEKSGVVLLIDPVDRRVMDRVRVEIQQNEHVEAVAGAGSVWVSSDSTPIRRVTGPDLAVRAEIDAGGGIPFVFRDGLIWGARPDELWAIDPATDDVTRRIELTGLIEILALDVRDGEAWIAARRPGRIGTVVRIDLDDGRLLGEFAVSLPAAVAITDTEVWVTNAGAGELLGLPR